MSNKLLKQNSIMLLYIINFIELMNNNLEILMKCHNYKSKYIDIRTCRELKKYFERCLKEVNK